MVVLTVLAVSAVMAVSVMAATPLNQKNPHVRKIRVCNSRAGNGCFNFMGA